MRTKAVYCDWCGVEITETLIVYQSLYLKPHGTHEGSRSSWDFCSDEHLIAWKDEFAMRRLTEKRSSRIGAEIPQEVVDQYRGQLISQIPERIAEALTGKWRNRGEK